MFIKFHIRANNDKKSQLFNFHTRGVFFSCFVRNSILIHTAISGFKYLSILTSIKERHNQNTYNGLEYF